nr:MAG TPA: hypothetical protein [Caudoviricetes sp.]
MTRTCAAPPAQAGSQPVWAGHQHHQPGRRTEAST